MQRIIKLLMGLFLSSALVACGGGGSGGGAGVTLSVDADLTTLTISAGTLDQIFDSAQLNYTATVSFLTASTQVTAGVSDAGATLTINGIAVASGVLSDAIALLQGGNPITIVVTAAAGNTRTYTISVTRESAAAFAQQAYIKASNTDQDDVFGTSVALSGDTLAVGTGFEDSNATGIGGNETDDSAVESGAVYVFTRSAGVWAQQAYIKASNADAGDGFGGAVAISGDTLVVGAAAEESAAIGINGNQLNGLPGSGAVYVFTRNGTVWTQQAYIKASNTDQFDEFGEAVAISGDTLVVGASGERSSDVGVNGNESDDSASGAGAVYVFTRSGVTWSQQAYIKASNTAEDDRFGRAVAISGNTLAVGAASEDSAATGINGAQLDGSASSGAVYVFVRSGSIWAQQAYVKASNTGSLDGFGVSVALSSDTLAVGAQFEDSPATGINGSQLDGSASSGAVYVFTRSGSTWTQQAYVKASNTEGLDGFGISVALSGDTLAVGASFEASMATGINGDQLDNTDGLSGAVYVFARSGSSWTQQSYVKASNTDQGDGFGNSIALSGGTLAVGAINEDSNAIGVGGDQSNGAVSNSGASYIFE